MRYSPALDGLRAVSILAVLAFHNSVLSPGAYANGKGYGIGGFLGVSVFFTLSGYLITELLLEESAKRGSIAFGRFFLRRVLRLYPALIVSLALCYLLWPILRPTPPFWSIATAVFFQYSNWVAVVHTFTALDPFGPCWSLALEWQFYVLWPFFVSLLWNKLRLRTGAIWTMLALAVLVALIRRDLTTLGSPWAAYPSPINHADALLVGSAAACATRVRAEQRLPSPFAARWAEAVAWLASATLLVLFATCRFKSDLVWLKMWGYGLLALLTSVLVAHVVAAPERRLARILAFRPLTAVGKRAYALYLDQLPLLWLVLPYRRPWGPMAIGESSLLLAVALFGTAWLSYDYVEQPLRRRFRARLTPPVPEPPRA